MNFYGEVYEILLPSGCNAILLSCCRRIFLFGFANCKEHSVFCIYPSHCSILSLSICKNGYQCIDYIYEVFYAYKFTTYQYGKDALETEKIDVFWSLAKSILLVARWGFDPSITRVFLAVRILSDFIKRVLSMHVPMFLKAWSRRMSVGNLSLPMAFGQKLSITRVFLAMWILSDFIKCVVYTRSSVLKGEC